MSETYNIPRDTTLARVAAALENVSEKLDGTEETYHSVMRDWFIGRGAEDADPETLTELCDEWYSITRPEWTGWTEFYQTNVSSVSTGTKGGDNEGMVCEPSTDTVKGQDDYAGNPLFACVDVNWEVDEETKKPVITAIDGITNGFHRKDPEKYVGVMQMSGYVFTKEEEETYIRGYSANRNVHFTEIEPLPSAKNPDGTVRSWVVHAKYLNSTVDGKMTSCAGLIPTAYNSHNTYHTLAAANGAQYSAETTADAMFLEWMSYIKYASLTMDGIIQGTTSSGCNFQYPAMVEEEGVKRVLVDPTNGANLEVGMSMLVGTYQASASSPLDRGTSSIYSVTGNTGAQITALEDVEINGETYTAVYFDDLDETFDTFANGASTDGTTYISTFHWATGKTDTVLGNDGSPVSCTSGKYPGKIQGIEFMNGAYEVLADVILQMSIDDNGDCYYEPYVVKDVEKQGTAIGDGYEATGLKCLDNVTSASWNYIKKKGYKDGVLFPIECGGSSTTYHRDGFYQAVPATQTRGWCARSALATASSAGGLSALGGNFALSSSRWGYGSRLSAVGTRGEWTA